MSRTQKVLLLKKQLYAELIESLGAFALWPLSETMGTRAADEIGGFNGTYSASVGLNAVQFPDGTPAPLFDAAEDVIAIPNAALDTPFNPALGTMGVWLKARASSVWTDGVSRIAYSVGVDANNRIFFNKTTTSNRFDVFYVAGGTSKQIATTSFNPTTWFHSVITWDVTSDEVKAYINGIQSGSTLNTLGTWAGALSDFTAIGNFRQVGGANFWDGYVKYPFLASRVFTPAEIAKAANPAFMV